MGEKVGAEHASRLTRHAIEGAYHGNERDQFEDLLEILPTGQEAMQGEQDQQGSENKSAKEKHVPGRPFDGPVRAAADQQRRQKEQEDAG